MCVTLDICVAGVKRPKLTMLKGVCVQQEATIWLQFWFWNLALMWPLQVVPRRGISVLANSTGPSSPHTTLGLTPTDLAFGLLDPLTSVRSTVA